MKLGHVHSVSKRGMIMLLVTVREARGALDLLETDTFGLFQDGFNLSGVCLFAARRSSSAMWRCN